MLLTFLLTADLLRSTRGVRSVNFSTHSLNREPCPFETFLQVNEFQGVASFMHVRINAV